MTRALGFETKGSFYDRPSLDMHELGWAEFCAMQDTATKLKTRLRVRELMTKMAKTRNVLCARDISKMNLTKSNKSSMGNTYSS